MENFPSSLTHFNALQAQNFVKIGSTVNSHNGIINIEPKAWFTIRCKTSRCIAEQSIAELGKFVNMKTHMRCSANAKEHVQMQE